MNNLKGKKSTQYSYPAYAYTHEGVSFKVWSASPKQWYVNFADIYFVSEEDGARIYSTKKQALDNALYYINRKQA